MGGALLGVVGIRTYNIIALPCLLRLSNNANRLRWKSYSSPRSEIFFCSILETLPSPENNVSGIEAIIPIAEFLVVHLSFHSIRHHTEYPPFNQQRIESFQLSPRVVKMLKHFTTHDVVITATLRMESVIHIRLEKWIVVDARKASFLHED